MTWLTLAMIPLRINCLIVSMGVMCNSPDSSFTLIEAGSSIIGALVALVADERSLTLTSPGLLTFGTTAGTAVGKDIFGEPDLRFSGFPRLYNTARTKGTAKHGFSFCLRLSFLFLSFLGFDFRSGNRFNSLELCCRRLLYFRLDRHRLPNCFFRSNCRLRRNFCFGQSCLRRLNRRPF